MKPNDFKLVDDILINEILRFWAHSYLQLNSRFSVKKDLVDMRSAKILRLDNIDIFDRLFRAISGEFEVVFRAVKLVPLAVSISYNATDKATAEYFKIGFQSILYSKKKAKSIIATILNSKQS